MAKRKLELIALALLVAYFVVFYATRTPVCEIGQVSRSTVSCRPPPAPNYERRHPRGMMVRLGESRTG